MKRKIHLKPYTRQETLIEAVQELWSNQEIQDMTIPLCDSMPTPALLLVLTVEEVIPPISAMTPYRYCEFSNKFTNNSV